MREETGAAEKNQAFTGRQDPRSGLNLGLSIVGLGASKALFRAVSLN